MPLHTILCAMIRWYVVNPICADPVTYDPCTKCHIFHRCIVDWGDGSEQQSKTYDVLTNCVMMHSYKQEIAHRNVTVSYCSQSSSISPTALTCAMFLRCIDISYDPAHLGDLWAAKTCICMFVYIRSTLLLLWWWFMYCLSHCWKCQYKLLKYMNCL